LFNGIFTPNNTTRVQWFLKGNTVIFIGRAPDDSKRATLNKKLKEKNKKFDAVNSKWCYRETDAINLVNIDTGRLIDGGIDCEISSYLTLIVSLLSTNAEIKFKVNHVLARDPPNAF
jgi:hypothetical protein